MLIDQSTPDTPSIFWPLRGMMYFCIRPQLWFAPIVTSVIAWCMSIVVCVAILWWTWPSETIEGFWVNFAAISWAIAYSVVAFVILWICAIPFVMGLAFERLALKVLQQQGYQAQAGEGVFGGLRSGMSILLRSLPWRILWLFLSVICVFMLPPVSIFVSALALGHICVFDATEMVLVLRGVAGPERRAFYKQHRSHLLLVGAVAGACSMVLALSIFGILFFVPSVVCAAALAIPRMHAVSPALEKTSET